jgi:hypothetical protein
VSGPGETPPTTVNMVDPHGRSFAVPIAEVDAARMAGFHPESAEENAARVAKDVRDERYGGVGGAVRATVAGAARAVSLGGLDAVADEDFRRDLRGLREVNPGATLVGDIGGTALAAFASGGSSLAASTPAALAMRGGRAVAALGEGAGVAGRIGAAAAGAALEGAAFGAGAGITELALSDDPVTWERATSTFSSHALFGAGIGAAAGTFAKGAELGLSKARAAIAEHAAQREAMAGLPADLATLDRAGLKAAHEAELAAIETERVLARRQVAADIGTHRADVYDTSRIWKATEGATDPEIRTIGKQAANADKQLRNLLDNPKYLASKPESAMAALQKQEHALEQMLAARTRIVGEEIAEPVFERAAAPPVREGSVVVRRPAGARPSSRELEVTVERPGAAPEVRRVTTAQIDDELLAQMPDGFRPDLVESRTPWSVRRGVPTFETAEKNAVYVVRPSELAERGNVWGNELKVANRDSVLEGWAQGKRLPMVDGRLTPDGRLFIEDGNHRLQAAAMSDRPIAIRFTSPKNYNPQASARDITDRVREELAAAARPTAAFDEALAAARTANAARATRATALDAAEVALQRNKGLQARIGTLTSKPASARLTAIAEAQDALAAIGSRPKTAAEQMLSGLTFGKASAGAGAVGAMVGGPVGALIGAAAPLVGAKAAQLVTEKVFGRVAKASAEAGARSTKAIDAFFGAGERMVKATQPLATRVLATVRYAPSSDERTAPAPIAQRDLKPATRSPELAAAYNARASEIRSQTMIGPAGVPVMRPEAREALAAQLSPIAAIAPLLADRMETVAARKLEFLAGKLAPDPDLGMQLGARPRQESDMQMRAFARLAAAAEDPDGVVERLASGTVTPEDAEAMRAVYPEMMASITQQIVERLPTLRGTLPYHRRLALSIFSGVPVDPALDPAVLNVLQAQFEYGDEPARGPRAQPQFGSVKKSAPEPTPAQERAAG